MGPDWRAVVETAAAASDRRLGVLRGKRSTPWGPGTVHDFMHAKVTITDDVVFLGSFNLSHSGEQNAENVLEIHDPALAERLAGFVDSVRGSLSGREPQRRLVTGSARGSCAPRGTSSRRALDADLLRGRPDLFLGELLELLLGLPDVDDLDSVVGLRDPVEERAGRARPSAVRGLISFITSLYWSSVAPLKSISIATAMGNLLASNDLRRGMFADRRRAVHSHSIVAGGFE